MAVQQKFNQLKDAPHEDKKAVAGGIAVAVVVILIFAWGFLFLRNVRNTNLPSLENAAVPTDQFNMNLIRNTERNQAIYDPEQDIRNLRDSATESDDSYGATGAGSTQVQEDDFTNSGGF
jgi:hypothetical protein